MSMVEREGMSPKQFPADDATTTKRIFFCCNLYRLPTAAAIATYNIITTMSNKQPEHPTSTPTKNGSRKNPKKEPVVDSRWENGQVSYDFCVARSILTCISNTIGCEIKFGGVTIPPKSDPLRLSKDDDDIKMLHSISMAYAQSFFDNTTDTETNGSNNKVWFDNVTSISHSDNGTNSLFTDFRMIMGASILHKVNISIYEHETQTMVPVCPYDESYNYDSELILTIWKRPIGTTIDLRWTPGFIDIHRVLFSVDTNPFTPLPQDIEFVRKIIDSLNQDIHPDIDNHFAGAFAIIPLHVLKMPKVLELVLGRILPKLLEIMQKEEYDGPNKMTKDMLNELLVASVGNDFDYSLLVDDNDIVEEVVEKKLNKLNQYGIYLQASNATIGDRRNQFEEQLQLHDDDNTFTILDKHMKSWLGYTNDCVPECELDIHLPEGENVPYPSSGYPVIFEVHGGGWDSGVKSATKIPITYWLERNYAFVSIEYVEDALNYMIEIGADQGLDTSRILTTGDSAGGHLACVVSYRADNPAIKGVMNFYGATEWKYYFDTGGKLLGYLSQANGYL